MSSTSNKRTQTLLLIQKLLSLREGASPLNLIVDSLEQTALPLLSEYTRQANTNGDKVIFISYDTLKAPPRVEHFLKARRRPLLELQRQVRALISPTRQNLIIIDSLHPLLDQDSNIVNLLQSFAGPKNSLAAVYHSTAAQTAATGPYSPSTLTLLKYLATTIIYVHSLDQAKAKHDAQSLSRAEPTFGLNEEKDGLLVGRHANSKTGILVEMEHRRKSGRAVGLTFVLRPASAKAGMRGHASNVTLRGEHAAFRTQTEGPGQDSPDFTGGTFNLDLTEKQRQAREGVVLPYFDAQTGGGQGGKILYEMDREDDFDEEEDEI